MLYGVLLLSVIECAAPPIRHPSATLTRAELAVFLNQSITFSARNTTPLATITIRHARPFPWMLLVAALYVCVTCTLLLRFGLNLLRLNRLANRSEPILDRDLRELGHEIWLQSLSQYRPQIRVSKDVRVPMAIGIEPVTICYRPTGRSGVARRFAQLSFMRWPMCVATILKPHSSLR